MLQLNPWHMYVGLYVASAGRSTTPLATCARRELMS